MRYICALLLLALLQIGAAVRLPAFVETVDSDLGRKLLGEKDHTYKADEPVPLWASKVGPFTNPRCAVTPTAASCSAQQPEFTEAISARFAARHMNITVCPTASPRMALSISS